MKKPVIPSDHKYSAGVISQQCPSCDWQDRRLKQERKECPNCGTEPSPPKLKFGGMEVLIKKNNQLEILNRYPEESAIIQESDLPDTIVFMLKNPTFWLDEDI